MRLMGPGIQDGDAHSSGVSLPITQLHAQVRTLPHSAAAATSWYLCLGRPLQVALKCILSAVSGCNKLGWALNDLRWADVIVFRCVMKADLLAIRRCMSAFGTMNRQLALSGT